VHSGEGKVAKRERRTSSGPIKDKKACDNGRFDTRNNVNQSRSSSREKREGGTLHRPVRLSRADTSRLLAKKTKVKGRSL